MFDFAKETKNMTAIEILNYYRNLYYTEPQVTERGIVANAINELLPNVSTVRHGQWVNVDINWERGYTIAQCSECGEKIETYKAIEKIKFCENCGAKMDGG